MGVFVFKYPNEQQLNASDTLRDCSIHCICNACNALIFLGLWTEWLAGGCVWSRSHTWTPYVLLQYKFSLIHGLATVLHIFSLINIQSRYIIGIEYIYVQYICAVVFWVKTHGNIVQKLLWNSLPSLVCLSYQQFKKRFRNPKENTCVTVHLNRTDTCFQNSVLMCKWNYLSYIYATWNF